MRYFKWKVFGPQHWSNVAAPSIKVDMPGVDGVVNVEGMFDTGADWTELQTGLMDTLGIAPAQCAASLVDGVWRPSTVVEARLDGHVFNLPVTFVDRYAGPDLVNLFGRIGILDQFGVAVNPKLKRSGFHWREGQVPSSAAIAFETHVAKWLEQHPEGFVAGEPYLAPA